uniref:Uncharacterized protein n=1 Tax=Arundo donax TaxID=35708 RepID=A0A0A9FSD7_ARUDO
MNLVITFHHFIQKTAYSARYQALEENGTILHTTMY